jgi:hypothetical protein
MVIADAVTALRTVAAVKEFVEGGALAVALTTIGGVHIDAALLCLRNERIAHDPRREVTLAIGHLQAASMTFRKLYADTSLASAGFNHDHIQYVVARDQEVNVLMATCYSYLGEPLLVRESLARAQDAWDVMSHKLDLPWGLLGVLNPAHVWKALIGSPAGLINTEKLREIRSALENL